MGPVVANTAGVTLKKLHWDPVTVKGPKCALVWYQGSVPSWIFVASLRWSDWIFVAYGWSRFLTMLSGPWTTFLSAQPNSPKVCSSWTGSTHLVCKHSENLNYFKYHTVLDKQLCSILILSFMCLNLLLAREIMRTRYLIQPSPPFRSLSKELFY